MKEKIEEIYMDTLKLTDDEWVAKYGEGNGYHEAFETLIQQEREEVVRGFAEYVEDVKNKGRVSSWVEEYFYLKENKE